MPATLNRRVGRWFDRSGIIPCPRSLLGRLWSPVIRSRSRAVEIMSGTATDPPGQVDRPASPTTGASELSAGTASEFVERLYRSRNSYADRLNGEELGWLDVD